MLITQSSSIKAIPFYMVDSTDHIAPKTGLTPTVTISKNGGTFAVPAGAISEVANGWYKIAGNVTDSNTVGALLVHATATGADPYDIEHEVVVFNVDSSTVTVGTNNDKTGYALTSAYDSAKTAASQANVATELTNYGALKPTVAGRTLDVTTTGEAGVDLDNTVGTLAKGTDLTGFNDLSAAQVNTECDTALADVGVTTTVTGRIDVAVSTRATPAQVDASLTTYGALKPTVAGRTLDVTTGGEAGVDWANIGAPTTTVALSGTTIGTVTNLTNDPPGVTTLLTRVSSTIFTGVTSMKEWLGLLAGKQVGNATARTEIRSSGAGAGTFDETTDSQEALRDRGDAAWITGAGGDPWATLIPGAYGAGTAGQILGGRLDAAVTTRATPAQVQTELGVYGALKPTVAARTLDVSAGGEAGVDWANVGTPGSTNNLSATTIATLTNAPADSAGVTTLLARIPAALFSGVTSLAQWLGMIAGKQVGNATARTEMRATGAGSGTFDETTDSQEALRDRGDAAWITGGAGTDPWLTVLPAAYGAGTAGAIVGNNLNATVSSRATPAQVQTELGTYGALRPTVAARTLDVSAGGEAGVDWANVGSPATAQNLSATTISTSQAVASVTSPVTLTAAYDAAKTASSQASNDQIYTTVDTEVAAIKAKTDQLTFGPNGVNCDVTLDVADLTALADAVLKRDWTLISGEAAYSLLNAARMLRNSWNTTGGTLSVKKEDGTTNAWTRVLSVDPSAQPIIGAT